MKKMKRMSRAKFENIAYLSLNIVNIAIYMMVFVAAILKAKEGSLADIIQAIYCTIISFLLVLHEFSTPAWALTYFGFLSIHRGKGLLMLFLGCLVMCKIPFNIIVAILAFTIGFTYFLLSLVPSLPPPNGFLVHWQNHKDFWAEGLDLNIPQNNIHNINTNLTPITMTGNNNMMMVSRPHNNTVPFLSLPHPSAWHPLSANQNASVSTSCYTSPINNNMDYSKFQHNFVQKDSKSKNFVIY